MVALYNAVGLPLVPLLYGRRREEVLLRRRLAVLLAAAMMLATAAPAFAQGGHPGDPCTEEDHPGHSAYAQHHIVPLAHDQELGQEHKPGSHQGYAGLCG